MTSTSSYEHRPVVDHFLTSHFSCLEVESVAARALKGKLLSQVASPEPDLRPYTLPTYLVLIPLIYVRYHFPDAWKRAKDRDTHILRCSLRGYLILVSAPLRK